MKSDRNTDTHLPNSLGETEEGGIEGGGGGEEGERYGVRVEGGGEGEGREGWSE